MNKTKHKGILRRLYPYTKNYRIPAVSSILSMTIETIVELLIPLVMANIVDVGIRNGDVSTIVRSGIVMVAYALFSLLTGVAASYFAAKASRGFGFNLRKAEFEKIQELSFANIDQFSSSSLITRLTNDVTRLERMLMMSLRLMIRAPMMFVSALVLSVYINADLALTFALAIPLLIAIVAFIVIRAYPLFGKMQVMIDKVNGVVQENLIAIRVVKAFVRHEHEIEKFDEVNTGLKEVSMDVFNKIVLLMPLMQLIVQGTTIAVMWFGARMVGAGTFEIGKLSSFVTYISQILMSVIMMSMILINFTRSIASAQRIVELLDVRIDITDETADADLRVKSGAIVFDHVNFKYHLNAEKNVLSDINLSMRSGELIGLIGGTGSAKSTLVQLIPRLYEASDGAVYVDGHNVKKYRMEELRDSVAMVLQNNTLFSGTIRNNLKWGNADATQSEVEAAAKAACAHDFIMEFPDGYDTELGQGGVNVSGGQKQRLCIARALLKNPKVLILDDSTSAVDTHTESMIRAAFRTALKDTTKIIIAQRISSVMDADQIIILDDGKIHDVGKHDELLKRNQIYQEIYYSQKEGADFDE